MVRVKRRRINFESHILQGESVLFKSRGRWYVGVVAIVKLRNFGNNYNRIVVGVQGNFVSTNGYHHVHNYGQSHVDQFHFTPVECEDGTLLSLPGDTDRVRKIVPIPDEYFNTNTPYNKWNVLEWRENLEMLQSVWFKNGRDTREKFECVVVDIKQDKLILQPYNSRLLHEVSKYSEQIQPYITVDRINYEDKFFYIAVPKYNWTYVCQTPICRALEAKDKYLGCVCTIHSRPDKSGFIVDVDYCSSRGGEDIYCYVEDRGATPNFPFLRFDTHMEYVEWVKISDIKEVQQIKNKLYGIEDTMINDKRVNTISVVWEHGLRSSEIESLFKLKEHDLKLMFYYILRHEKNHSSNNILFAISYLIWSHASYVNPTLYSPGHDNYHYGGLKNILTAKQDFYRPQKGILANRALDAVGNRFHWMLSASETCTKILKAEDLRRRHPIFSFDPINITLSEDKKEVTLEINVEYNNVSNLDVVSYTATAINMNQVSIYPLMRLLLPDERRYNTVDVFKFKNYGRRNVNKFKREETNYMSENKINMLKKYQSYIVKRMIEEENAEVPISDVFSSNFSGSMCYNSLVGFFKKDDDVSYGGFLSLDVGWGKTVIIIELILRQGGTNLVCVPVSLLDQWKSEIARFAPSLTVAEYYGRNKSQDADIVLTTYGTLRQTVDELKEFDRVIFEESHTIKNSVSQRAKACVKIRAKKRWLVTATPYNDNNNEFQTQLRMLKIKPFHLNTPLVNNNGLFKKMFRRCVLSLDSHRLKEMGIVPIKKKVKQLKHVYIESDDDTLKLLQALKSKTLTTTYTPQKIVKPAAIATQIAVTHPSFFPLAKFSILNKTDNQEVTKDQLVQSLENRSNINEAYKQSVIEKLNNENDGTCCICLDAYSEPTITPCLHIYCNGCIKNALKHRKKCPQCRQDCDVGQLKKMVTAHVQSEDRDNTHFFTDILGNSYSVPTDVKEAYDRLKEKTPKKFEYLKKFINETKGACVIFSQYQIPLVALSKYLKKENMSVGIITGRTTRKKRGEMIEDFANGKLKTFLLTTRTASVGINLQKGSTIIFLEPILSMADRIQAVGRLHRIGQTEDIDVMQLCSKNTYEHGMIKTLEEFKDEEKSINRMYKGRQKNKEQSALKYKMYYHIVNEAI